MVGRNLTCLNMYSVEWLAAFIIKVTVARSAEKAETIMSKAVSIKTYTHLCRAGQMALRPSGYAMPFQSENPKSMSSFIDAYSFLDESAGNEEGPMSKQVRR